MTQSPLAASLIPAGCSSVAEMFRFRASDPSNQSTISFYDRKTRRVVEEDQVSFLCRAAALSSHLQSGGVSAGKALLVVCSSPRATLLSFVAGSLAGAIPMVVPVRAAFDDRRTISRRVAQAASMVGDGACVVTEVRNGTTVVDDAASLPVITLDASWDQLLPINELRLRTGTGTSHFQLTSGSTGDSKAIVLTDRNVVSNIEAIVDQTNGYGKLGSFVGWLPLYHDMGLISQALAPLVTATDVTIMSPFDFLAHPLDWVRLLSEKKATVTASPSFGYQLVTERSASIELRDLDLSSLRSACCGAEPISAGVVDDFLSAFGGAGLTARAFAPSYGLAEATLAVTISGTNEEVRTISVSKGSLSQMGTVEVVGLDAADAVRVVALGKAVPGMEFHIRDRNGSRVDADLVCGEVVVSGASVASAAVTPDGRREALESELPTGDLGFSHDGDLFIVERIKNIIIRNGQNFSSSVLESTLASLADVAAGDVVVVDRDIIAGSGLTGIVEIGKDADAQALLDAVEASIDLFEPPLDEVVLVKKGCLPRTTSGKKRHLESRTALNDQRLLVLDARSIAPSSSAGAETLPQTVVATAVDEEAHDDERLLLEVVSEQVRTRGIDLPVMLGSKLHHDLDFDSLAMLELAMIVESKFEVQFSHCEVAEVKTIADLLAAIRRVRTTREVVQQKGLVQLVEEARAQIPQYYTAVEEVSENRRVKIDGRWVNDFASGCYMALDEDQRVIDASARMTSEWGLQRGWTRAVASPQPLIDLEKRLAASVGVDDVMIFGTVTLLHFGVLPLLAGQTGAIVIDSEAHKSMHEASALARAKGTAVTTFKHGDTDDLREKLSKLADKTQRVVVLDGVYSMKGHTLDLPEYQKIAEEYDALLYIDDAHGYGILGENPSEASPYGHGGSGMVKHLGCTYDRIIYVGGMTKSYSAMLAFITCPSPEYKRLFQMASTMIFVHAPPVSTIAQAHAVLDINETEGDEIRDRLYSMTKRLIDGAKQLGFEVKTSSFPIVNVIMGDLEAVIAGCRTAWDHGMLITPAVFPAAAIDKGGLRFTVTASNTHDQIDAALAALTEIRMIQDAKKSVDMATV